MSFRELRTILHELGHCVHALVGKQRYAQFAGIGPAIEMDFVEAPSQMLELWLTHKSLFDFAVNKEGKRIPDEMLDRLLAAAEIGRGLQERGQLVMAKYAVRPVVCGSTRRVVAELTRDFSWTSTQRLKLTWAIW
jgi:Zn-dependent oligopeptidase